MNKSPTCKFACNQTKFPISFRCKNNNTAIVSRFVSSVRIRDKFQYIDVIGYRRFLRVGRPTCITRTIYCWCSLRKSFWIKRGKSWWPKVEENQVIQWCSMKCRQATVNKHVLVIVIMKNAAAALRREKKADRLTSPDIPDLESAVLGLEQARFPLFTFGSLGYQNPFDRFILVRISRDLFSTPQRTILTQFIKLRPFRSIDSNSSKKKTILESILELAPIQPQRLHFSVLEQIITLKSYTYTVCKAVMLCGL